MEQRDLELVDRIISSEESECVEVVQQDQFRVWQLPPYLGQRFDVVSLDRGECFADQELLLIAGECKELGMTYGEIAEVIDPQRKADAA